MTEPDLFSVLDRATDRIDLAEPAHLGAAAALTRARTVRTRRRAAVATGLAAVVVLAVALVSGGGLHRADAPVPPASRVVPPIRADVVQDVWNPRTAADLPSGSTALPARLVPPAHPAPLPLSGPARAVLQHGQSALAVLGADGSWAGVRSPDGPVNGAALSRDGTMLALVGQHAIWTMDVRVGRWRQVELPTDGGPAMMWAGIGARATWADDHRLLVHSFGGGVATLHPDGSAPPTSSYYGTAATSGLALAPDGDAVLFAQGRRSRVIEELRSGSPTRTLDAGALERVAVPVASDDRVVGTVSGIPGRDRPTDHAGLVVLDRAAGYATLAYLPIAGTHYQPGVGIAELGVAGVRPLAWVDGHTVLLQLRSDTYGGPWSLVTWDVDSGDLARVAWGGKRTHLEAVAADLVVSGS